MHSTNIVDTLIKDIEERLTLDGKNRVFNEGKELRSEFMNEEAEPEAFTREFLINKIFSALELEKLPENFEEEGSKTNLLGLVEHYSKDRDGLETDEEKLKVIKEFVERIKGNKKVKEEIEKIKNHEWVKVIEGGEK